MPVKPLGRLIDDISTYDKYIEISEKLAELPSIGKLRPIYPYWLRYTAGNLLFAMNMDRDPVLKEMIDRVEIILQGIIPKPYKIEREAIQLVRTMGSIKAHSDLTRYCAISIGLRNSSSAITRVCTSDDNSYNSFKLNRTEFSVAEGYGYLFNTKQRHSVIGSDVPRYIISYGMRIPYAAISEGILCRLDI